MRTGRTLVVGDMKGQLEACYECVSRSLDHLGLGWPTITHRLIFTTDVDSYIEHERNVAPQFFEKAPPSTLVEVPRLVDRDWLVDPGGCGGGAPGLSKAYERLMPFSSAKSF